jgi:hypothetical protein
MTGADRDGETQRLDPVGRQMVHIDGGAYHRSMCVRYGLAAKGVQLAVLQIPQSGREAVSSRVSNPNTWSVAPPVSV